MGCSSSAWKLLCHCESGRAGSSPKLLLSGSSRRRLEEKLRAPQRCCDLCPFGSSPAMFEGTEKPTPFCCSSFPLRRCWSVGFRGSVVFGDYYYRASVLVALALL